MFASGSCFFAYQTRQSDATPKYDVDGRKIPRRGFLVITQHQPIRIGPKLEEINPTSLPDLLKPLGTLNLKEKTEKSKN